MNFKIKNLCQKAFKTFQANIRLDEDVLKTSWRRLSSLSSEDVLIKTNMFALALRLQKTSWSRPIYSSWPYVFKTSSRRLAKMSSRRFQDVFKTSCKNVFKTSSRRLQDVLKTSSKRLQDVLKNVFKTSSRRLQDVLQRYLQDVFKTYHQVKLFLLTRLREVLNTFLRHSFLKTVIYRRICLSKTTSEIFMVSVQNSLER